MLNERIDMLNNKDNAFDSVFGQITVLK
ncbi:hypothetical protein CNEO4_1470029 [Clostridium neonatale]|nr:hypothetical protein CNEO4_2070029 [Clostridium neonatale]CAI3596631.1 hypothetical protein CNEO4_1470029 [Clostridium neonatale]CAI3601734.1 hypothetical protein CNEO4_1810029 [Clostridium neonatale]CAI3616702.1 hypothetical protein CNEO4_1500029 [Clostridium neonatale]CAI3703964.1 hypothetical protein CNEO3_710029 [Clostridium neonatale]